jgi:hypothetical protein
MLVSSIGVSLKPELCKCIWTCDSGNLEMLGADYSGTTAECGTRSMGACLY